MFAASNSSVLRAQPSICFHNLLLSQ